MVWFGLAYGLVDVLADGLTGSEARSGVSWVETEVIGTSCGLGDAMLESFVWCASMHVSKEGIVI